ncbi:hypothetical protein [Bacillus manliponensis]|uniref:hypothetical protein n=1 Tax=Bacillus manliponensis TaxID=574376 RepID=UPI0035139819
MVWTMLILSAICMILEWVCIGFGIWKGFFVSNSKKERAKHLFYYSALGIGCYFLSHLFSEIGLFFLHKGT